MADIGKPKEVKHVTVPVRTNPAPSPAPAPAVVPAEPATPREPVPA